MVKFFLRNQKHPPKSQPCKKNKQSSKSKGKKVLDFRIVIWKKLFNLIKTQHSLMLQKLIRKIKQTKQKLQLRQPQTSTQANSQTKLTQLKKDLTSLDAKYQTMKSIKKPQLKHITLYIILQVLKIQNIQKIIQKAKLDKSLQTRKLKEDLEGNQAVKKFIQKLSLLTVYQKELEACAQLVDLVQEKKLERKTKLKQKKQKKYQREHGLETEKEDKNKEEDGENQQDDDGESSEEIQNQSHQIQEQKQIKPTSKPTNQFQKTLNKHHQHKNHQTHKNNKPFNKQPYPAKPSYHKQKPIHKQRTQFRKTGRNKVKYQKEQKKLHFKNKGKQQQSNPAPKEKPKRKGQFSFSKEQAHPSWKAKQQLKQEVFIQPFQGKKMLL